MENERDVIEVFELEENAPYFINEGKFGEVYVVNNIELFEGDNIKFNHDSDPLILGKDILEVPNRKLEIIVEYTHGYFIKSFVDTLRKYAYLNNYDYVYYENYASGFMNDDLCKRGNIQVSKIMPRLFRKILNN